METKEILQYIIGFVIVLIIIILLYYIISYLIFLYRNDKTQLITKTNENIYLINQDITKQSLDSKNMNQEYLNKHTISKNYEGYGNYKLFSNVKDNRIIFQSSDGTFYQNIDK